jgi:predicted XRE-type DNA-binding protein
MKETTDDDITFLSLPGNVFEQLRRPNSDELEHKSALMSVINEAIKRQGLTQVEAAKKVGLGQADISRLAHGRGERYSIERLMNIIHRLGIDVEVVQYHDEDGYLFVEAREVPKPAIADVLARIRALASESGLTLTVDEIVEFTRSGRR